MSILAIPNFINSRQGIEVNGFKVDTQEYSPETLLFGAYSSTLIIIPYYGLAQYTLIRLLVENKSKQLKYDINREYIQVTYKTFKRTFTSFEGKFLQDFENIEQYKILSSIDEYEQPTAAMDALMRFRMQFHENEFAANNIFHTIFPPIKKGSEEAAFLLDAKQTTAPLMYLRKPGIYTPAYSYDQKKAYSSLVYGVKHVRENLRKGLTAAKGVERWNIYKIMLYPCIPLKYDFLNLLPKFFANYQLPIYITVTEDTLHCIETYYTNVKYEIIDQYAYIVGRSQFDKFIAENEKLPLKMGKIYNNLIIGTFGKKMTIRKNNFALEGKRLYFTPQTIERKEGGFLPLWLYVVSKQVRRMLETVFPFWDKVLYMNTDGFITNHKIDVEALNATRTLGKWELRAEYWRIGFKAINNYCGEIIDNDGIICLDSRTSGYMQKPLSFKAFAEGYKTRNFIINELGFPQCKTVQNQSIAAYAHAWDNVQQSAFLEKVHNYADHISKPFNLSKAQAAAAHELSKG